MPEPVLRQQLAILASSRHEQRCYRVYHELHGQWSATGRYTRRSLLIDFALWRSDLFGHTAGVAAWRYAAALPCHRFDISISSDMIFREAEGFDFI